MFGVKKCKRLGYNDGCAKFADRIVYDKDVALFVEKHLRFIDRFNVRKIAESALISFSMLSGSVDIPKGKWKF